jgi:hypothetical protein
MTDLSVRERGQFKSLIRKPSKTLHRAEYLHGGPVSSKRKGGAPSCEKLSEKGYCWEYVVQ